MSEQNAGPPVWLISFTDVIALMLTFFVLLYAMSSPDETKWEKKIGVTAQAFAQNSGARNQAGSDEGVNLSRLSYAQAENLDYLSALFEEMQATKDGDMSITRKGNYLLLSFEKRKINNNKFFNELTPILKSLDNQITLMVSSDLKGGFSLMQSLGERLKDNGYRRPFVIQQVSNIVQVKNGFALSLQPHDGRRINR